MTTAVVEDIEADWVIIRRLMRKEPVGDRPATDEEIRLAAWLMFDLAYEPHEIQYRLNWTRNQTSSVARLRKLAAQRRKPNGRDPVHARSLAPTARHRMMLAIPGITRPTRRRPPDDSSS
jgi:hypothetical protein